jgi:ABC-type uncharacterized transport system substrate-binding protein
MALALALMPASGSFAADEIADEVNILLSSDAPYYEQVAQAFTEQLAVQQSGISVRKHVLVNSEKLLSSEGMLIIAIGSKATSQAMASYPDANILSLLVPMAAWLDLNVGSVGGGRYGAVVIDQPFERALLLGKVLNPRASKFGAVFGPSNQSLKKNSVEQASDLGLELHAVDLPPADNPISTISPIIKISEVFIAVPDRAAFNRNIAKWILHLSFRQQIPVIGFSSSYTQAGALASIYSSPENIGRHGAELFAELLPNRASNPATTDNKWRAYYPKYFTLSTNSEVAGVLDIDLPPLGELYRMYRAALRSIQ